MKSKSSMREILGMDGVPRIRVLGPRVLLQRLDLPEQSQGGLYVLGREFPTIACVLAVGTGWRLKRRKRGAHVVSGVTPGLGVGLGDVTDEQLEQSVVQAFATPFYDVDARIQLDVQVGDKVTYDRFAWEKFELPKAPNLAIMPYDELILCIED